MWLSLARAPGLGPGGRRFESCHPDSYKYARVAQLVERDLAKVEAAGSSPVSRSFLFLGFMRVPRYSGSAFSLHNRNYLKFLLEVFTLSARVWVSEFPCIGLT